MSPDPADVADVASLSLVLQHAPVILFATDLDGRITLSTGQGLHALGIRPHEMVGQNIRSRTAPWGDVGSLIDRAFDGGVVSGTYMRADRHYQLVIQPLLRPDGQQIGITGVAIDITPQVQATRQAEALLRLSEMLDEAHSRPTLRETLSAALKTLADFMPLDFLILWAPQDGEYRATAWYGPLPEAVSAYARQGVATASALRWTRTAGGTYLTDEEVPPALRALGVTGIAVLPLPGGVADTPTLLCAYRLQEGPPWTLQEQTLLQAAVRSIAVLQARRQHLHDLEEAALTDPLTRLPNRRAFDQDLADALSRPERQQGPLGLLITDIDGLKAVNDTQGHERGDELLRTFAAALRAVLREGDRCYRLGGDEFAVLLPAVGEDSIPTLLTRLERTLELLRYEGFPDVRASGGGAVFPDEASTGSALLHLADQRMYHVKATRQERTGRTGTRKPG
ncbi:diguanylate cyclase [Deinococcus sp. KSM4-11]|uniref:sensor domain-containing diguanylate cyclase n=1 Tax=Deinococcus sp. KSM4-11 TaxID=2568654 RepID=UPI0010A34EBA|nr:diguanylate cyclase [Deinococcus sp. KSM4-11]THF85552.1 diguanylate cyclase [Deinococcus sp. KSM4-11]